LRPAERFLNYSPNSITAQSLMLRVLEAMSQWQRAEQLVKRWISRTGDELRRQAYAHQLVSIYQAARQWDKADEWIQKQIKSADDDEQRLRWQTSRLLLHARAERWKDFLKTAKAWMARYPDNIGIREMVVSLLLEGHRYKLADELLSDWQKAAPLRPGRAMPGLAATTLDLRISWFSYQQKHKQALKLVEERIGQLTQILQDTPQNQYATQRLADLKNRRAGLLAEMGQNDKAMALMETALDKDPENASLNNNLAYRYSEEAIKLDKAEKMVQKAIDISGPIIAYVDTKAWVYYKTGRISEAAELLVGIVRQEDLSDDPVVHPVIYDHTGDALYRLGWKAWALQIWRQSLELAGKQKYKDSDAQRLQKLLPLKIQAVEAGREPNIAPLAPAGAAALDAKADSNAPPAGDGRTPPNP
jgi:tetratricopeptide (TPR) repeat protein